MDLKLVLQQTQTVVLYYIDMTDSYTRIRMYYRDTTGDNSDHDTLDFDFNINANCAYFHHVEHDYS